MKKFYAVCAIAAVALGGLLICCDKKDASSAPPAPERNAVLSEGFENGISDYMQVTYAPEQGLMSVSTNYAHSGTHSLTSDSNNTGIRKSLDDPISDSIAGLEFYLMAKKAERTNFVAVIARSGSSANGLYTILGMGIDKSDSLKYIYEYQPDDTSNEHKNFAALEYDKWYKCNIEYDFNDSTVTYFLDGRIVHTRSTPNLIALTSFVIMRDSLGSPGPKDYYVDDVTIYKR